MLQVVLGIVLAFVVFVVVLNLAMRAAVRYVSHFVESRHRAVDCIVNGGCVPEAWAHGFVQSISAMQRRAEPVERLERLGQQARSHFLRELDSLIRYFEHSGTFDSEQTRQILLEALREQRDQWVVANWRTLLGFDFDGETGSARREKPGAGA